MNVINVFTDWFKKLSQDEQTELILYLEKVFLNEYPKLFNEALNLGVAPINRLQKALNIGIAPQSTVCPRCGRPM